MFNSTHTLVGFAIARTGVEKWARYATATAVIASNLPDVDSVAGLWGTATYLDHHRGITHSLIGVPFLALLLTVVMYVFSGKFWKTYAIALIAMATHPALDYLNPYGLRPFLPLSNQWYYGDLVFIFDPYLDFALFLGVFGGWLLPRWKRTATWVSLFVAIAYVGVRVQLHGMAASKVETRNVRAVMPTVWDPRLWEAVSISNTQVSRVDICATPCIKSNTEVIALETTLPSAAVERAAMAPSAAALLRFARFPVTRVEQLDSGYRVTFLDFRFYREATQTALASEVTLDNSMRVTNESISFTRRIAWNTLHAFRENHSRSLSVLVRK